MRKDLLLSLILKRLDGQLSTEEAIELDSWVAESPANGAWLDRLSDEEFLEKELQQYRGIDSAEAHAKWVSDMQARQRSRILKIVGWAVAASLLITVSVIGIMRKPAPGSGQVLVAATNAQVIQPGRNTAILTLSNGQKVLLDSARVGDLATQGNARLVKADSGRLSYSVTGRGKEVGMVYNTLTTPRSGQFQILLPDGSHVWLNNMSSLRYPTSFLGKNRTVELNGEAYFEIAKDAAKPFVVKVNNEEVDVLGTSFNIMAYPDEKSTQTTLLTGIVRVKAGQNAVQLQPDEQAQFSENGGFKVLRDVPSTDIISWKNGFFYFGRAPFTEVMRQLARWYDVDVKYEGTIPDLEFGGKIDRSLPLNELLKFLDKNQVHFRLEGRTIVVLSS
jgi:transmembrane sensor